MQVKKDQGMWLSSLGDVELLWWDSNILVCSHEPSTSHVNQDYQEPSGFQNCLQGLWYYLLSPNPVVQYLGCRLREQTALNLSMKCIRQQRSGSAGPPFRKSYLHLTHDVNLLRENQYQAAEADEVVWQGFLWHLAVFTDAGFFLSLCCQTSSRKKPAARIGTPLGSRVRALPASQSGHLQAHIKATALVSSFLPRVCCFRWPPPAKRFLCTNSVPLSALTTVTEVGSYHWAEVRFTSAACHLSLYDLSRVSS